MVSSNRMNYNTDTDWLQTAAYSHFFSVLHKSAVIRGWLVISYACDLIFSFFLIQTVCQDVGGDEADDDEQQVFKTISVFYNLVTVYCQQ